MLTTSLRHLTTLSKEDRGMRLSVEEQKAIIPDTAVRDAFMVRDDTTSRRYPKRNENCGGPITWKDSPSFAVSWRPVTLQRGRDQAALTFEP